MKKRIELSERSQLKSRMRFKELKATIGRRMTAKSNLEVKITEPYEAAEKQSV